MERLAARIREIAGKISGMEDRRKKLAEFLTEVGPVLEFVKTPGPGGLADIRIAGIDGGLSRRSFHGFDCVLTRAAAACFSYRQGKVAKVEYIPSKIPSIQPDVVEALTDIDWAYHSSIFRMKAEVSRAIECAEMFRPDLLLMDGSIVPHHSDKPSKSSRVYTGFTEMLALFEKLYSECTRRNILLAGVIEDSRGTRFCGMVAEKILSSLKHPAAREMQSLLSVTRDTNLLYYVLRKGDMSHVFPYSEKPSEHPVLRELSRGYGSRIHSFYLKTAERDRPVRVDFLSDTPEETGERIASILLPISGHHSGYGLPAPLIEADNVAKIPETEMENFYMSVLGLTGNLPSMMRLRRDQRPF
jgi:hypothetical protein